MLEKTNKGEGCFEWRSLRSTGMNRSDTIRAHGDARQACMTGLIPAQPSFLLVVSALCARQRKPDTAYLKSARRPRTLTRTNPPLSPRQPLKLMEMEGSFLWGRLTHQHPFSTLPYGSGCLETYYFFMAFSCWLG